MLNSSWVAFLRHLPPALQQGLAVKTLGGTEVSVQVLLRIDHEFFAFKGRLAGTQDAGRVFFVPYEQIDHLYYQKEVREEDFCTAFDSLKMPSAEEVGVQAPTRTAPPAETPVAPVPEAPAPEPTPVNRPTAVPIKSAVLERFRSRSSSTARGRISVRRGDSPSRTALLSSAVWPPPKQPPPAPRR